MVADETALYAALSDGRLVALEADSGAERWTEQLEFELRFAPPTLAGNRLYVLKRDGRREPVSFDKVATRISLLTYNLDPSIDPSAIAQQVVRGMYPGIKTSEVDTLAASTAVALTSDHPDHAILAARIVVGGEPDDRLPLRDRAVIAA